MSMGSFFKSLFGGREASPGVAGPAPAPAVSTPRDAVNEANRALRRLSRTAEPVAWAEAQQMLGYALIGQAREHRGSVALDILRDADRAFEQALDAIAVTDHHPHFKGSILNQRGSASWTRTHLLDGDDKGRLLAEAANQFGEAAVQFSRETGRENWFNAILMRGAALHEMARMHAGRAARDWLDEAATCFAEAAEHGSSDPGVIHPVAAFNRYIVLEDRAKISPPDEAREIFGEARRALLISAADKDFAAQNPDIPQRLAALDAAIAATG
jgi:hypothetical protein